MPIAADLEAVVLKGLAKKPGDRFATAREFADALAACRDAGTWTRSAADAWWQAQLAAGITDMPTEATARIHAQQTLVSSAPSADTSS